MTRPRRLRPILVPAVLLALLLPGSLPAAEKKDAKGKKDAEKEKKEDKSPWKSETFAGLELRSIGPALTSGRIVDVAVDPVSRATWYVASASGGVWKTENAGTTWKAIFDDQGSFSIGCVTVDPKNPMTVWVGTGENNSQRSVAYGDGVYKSIDGGRSFEKVGLGESEHIGKILLDPRDGNVVYVAAQGPLWRSGGDRGLYKSTDGGKTWKRILEVDEDTGATDIAFDPKNPDVVLAATYQRRRHVWTLVDGGPGSGIHRSTDAGATWKKLEAGLPSGEVGRIGIAAAPSAPGTFYAVIEGATKKDGGFYRSTDGGVSWDRRSDTSSPSAQYYQELFVDPKDESRVYSVDTELQVSEDGGKTFQHVPENYKHVDNHVVWIDETDTDHLLVGCDGGLYETRDRAETWKFFSNLPVTQFYRVEVDDRKPFYTVYGGTQDNWSLGGPSETRTANGIVNSDWFVTVGGDGFFTKVDPTDSDIVYSEWQYGGLVRYDRKTGEAVDIQPQPGIGSAAAEDSDALKWNWDTPLLVSPHAHTRLYYAAQRVFRSDDRGDTWRAISGDLTQKIDRNRLPVMGRVRGIDSVAKNASTSLYGNIVAIDESPKKEGLLFVGTDDGLVQITEDGGTSWRRAARPPGLPEWATVSDVSAGKHDANTVYVTYENHQMGDFKPYAFVSKDLGRSWSSISSNLPERGGVWCLAEDHLSPDLLFVGTEFGLYFSVDAGKDWVKMPGLPTIAVRDLAIQKRENDLVLATFGRGFYVLDDYSALRSVTKGKLESSPALMFDVPSARAFVPSTPIGSKDSSYQGDAFFHAPNPPAGATFTWYLKEDILDRKGKRKKEEGDLAKEKKDVFYPTWEALRAEAREEDPEILFVVRDSGGRVVRQLTAPAKKGFHRTSWDLHRPPLLPVSLEAPELDPLADPPVGPLVPSGSYTVELGQRIDGVFTRLAEPKTFRAEPLGGGTLPVPAEEELAAHRDRAGRLQRAVLGAQGVLEEATNRIKTLRKAIPIAAHTSSELEAEARALELRLIDLGEELNGDPLLGKKNEPTVPSLVDRMQRVVDGTWYQTGAPTKTHVRNLEVAESLFGKLLPKLRTAIETDLAGLEKKAEAAGAPWTPGRIPTWSAE